MRWWTTFALLTPLLGAVAAGCTQSGYVVVDVRTDLRAGTEFQTVRVTLGGSARERPDDGKLDWAAGIRAAEFDGLGEGLQRLDVALLDRQGVPVLHRPVTVRVRGATVATVLLTRRCVGVTCDSLDEACHFGRCVDLGCSEEHPELCGERECAEATDCALTPTECAVPTCSASGGCWLVAQSDSCPAGASCDPSLGCVAGTLPSVDAGPIEGDNGAADAGVSEPLLQTFGEVCYDASGSCEYQASICAAGEAAVACDWLLRRGCAPGLRCSGPGELLDEEDPRLAGAGLFCTSPCSDTPECVAAAAAAGLPFPDAARCVGSLVGSFCSLDVALGWEGCRG